LLTDHRQFVVALYSAIILTPMTTTTMTTTTMVISDQAEVAALSASCPCPTVK
jgi:hypothetical protein